MTAKNTATHLTASLVAVLLCAVPFCQRCSGDDIAATAARLLADSGVSGGLVVHLGCDDGKLTAALHAGPSYLVHGLDTDPTQIELARAHVRSLNLDGTVSFERWSGERLPYIDNLVRLIVAQDLGRTSREEMLRVLCPGGVAMIRTGPTWKKVVKPWPGDIDQWTHYLHGPSNNAVAQDTVIGPPRRLQWIGPPRWTRDHGKINSISSVVTAAGRVYFILDTATGSSMNVPGNWMLVARDAFNGVELWRQPIKSWAPPSVRFRSGPPQLPRLLVASENHVYAPLGWNEPVSQMDARTGEVLATFASTRGAQEIVLCNNRLLVLHNVDAGEAAVADPKSNGKARRSPAQAVVAVDAESGQTMWEAKTLGGRLMPETLGSDGHHVCLQVGEGVVCLDLESGNRRWTYGAIESHRERPKRSPGFGTHVLVMADDVVLCELSGELIALALNDGSKLWSCPGGQGFHAPLDVFVIDGIVWTGNHPKDSVSPPPVDDFSVGRDLHTGEVKFRNSVMVDLQSVGHHHRCYRNKASLRYIMSGKRGIEMFDLTGNDHSRNNWVRGTCQYGIMPANGLIYAPPHSCGCYTESMVRGFVALAPAYAPEQLATLASRKPDARRLEKGPAYGTVKPGPGPPDPADWPMFRHDSRRTGVVETDIPVKIAKRWDVAIGDRLSQPVIAGGKLVVADVDAHRVHALDAATGAVLWSFTAGGRVDSPPAIYKHLVLFGSADGWVYCLRLDDGQLIWRFLAAPTDLRTVSWNQLESVWPVHGSVLLLDDTVYLSAGRSTWLDSGIDLYGLDPMSGNIKHYQHFESEQPKFRQGKDKADAMQQEVAAFDEGITRQLARGSNRADYKSFFQADRSVSFSMAGGTIADILVSDGANVFLHQVKFGADLNLSNEMSRHLFSTSGFLCDATEESRTHWILGTGDFATLPFPYVIALRQKCDVQPVFGMGMAYDDQIAWSVLRRRSYSKDPMIRVTAQPLQATTSPETMKWQVMIGELRPRSILKAGGQLWIGAEQDGHGVLKSLAGNDGQTIETTTIDAPMVWDGMAAANQCLYVSLANGHLACFGPRKKSE